MERVATRVRIVIERINTLMNGCLQRFRTAAGVPFGSMTHNKLDNIAATGSIWRAGSHLLTLLSWRQVE
jgi:hypothetical protein